MLGTTPASGGGIPTGGGLGNCIPGGKRPGRGGIPIGGGGITRPISNKYNIYYIHNKISVIITWRYWWHHTWCC